jgi:hypothetical protein
MIRTTASLAAIFLLSQITLGHTQADAGKLEPLDPSDFSSESPSYSSLGEGLDSLRTDCAKNGKLSKNGYDKICVGQTATLLFQMLGRAGAPAKEIKYGSKRYLERSSNIPEIKCWQIPEVTDGDPIVVVVYRCGVRAN